MDDIETSLLVVLAVGFVVAIGLDFYLPPKERPFQVAMLVGAIFLDIGAFVPQIIENAQKPGKFNSYCVYTRLYLMIHVCMFRCHQ